MPTSVPTVVVSERYQRAWASCGDLGCCKYRLVYDIRSKRVTFVEDDYTLNETIRMLNSGDMRYHECEWDSPQEYSEFRLGVAP